VIDERRFVGDHVLYGAKLERSAREPKRAERKLVTYRYASRSSAAAQALALDRLERCAQTDVVVNRQAVDRFFETPSGGATLRRPPIFKKREER